MSAILSRTQCVKEWNMDQTGQTQQCLVVSWKWTLSLGFDLIEESSVKRIHPQIDQVPLLYNEYAV